MLMGIGALCTVAPVHADTFDEFPPSWEPLLWGGKIVPEATAERHDEATAGLSLHQAIDRPAELPKAVTEQPLEESRKAESSAAPAPGGAPLDERLASRTQMPAGTAEQSATPGDEPEDDSLEAATALDLSNIPPLYVNPRLPGEGTWDWQNLPVAPDGSPLMFRTSYRPSVRYPERDCSHAGV